MNEVSASVPIKWASKLLPFCTRNISAEKTLGKQMTINSGSPSDPKTLFLINSRLIKMDQCKYKVMEWLKCLLVQEWWDDFPYLFSLRNPDKLWGHIKRSKIECWIHGENRWWWMCLKTLKIITLLICCKSIHRSWTSFNEYIWEQHCLVMFPQTSSSHGAVCPGVHNEKKRGRGKEHEALMHLIENLPMLHELLKIAQLQSM